MHPAVLLLPDVERRFADAELPADIRHCCVTLGLSEAIRDLNWPQNRDLRLVNLAGVAGEWVHLKKGSFGTLRQVVIQLKGMPGNDEVGLKAPRAVASLLASSLRLTRRK